MHKFNFILSFFFPNLKEVLRLIIQLKWIKLLTFFLANASSRLTASYPKYWCRRTWSYQIINHSLTFTILPRTSVRDIKHVTRSSCHWRFAEFILGWGLIWIPEATLPTTNGSLLCFTLKCMLAHTFHIHIVIHTLVKICLPRNSQAFNLCFPQLHRIYIRGTFDYIQPSKKRFILTKLTFYFIHTNFLNRVFYFQRMYTFKRAPFHPSAYLLEAYTFTLSSCLLIFHKLELFPLLHTSSFYYIHQAPSLLHITFPSISKLHL